MFQQDKFRSTYGPTSDGVAGSEGGGRFIRVGVVMVVTVAMTARGVTKILEQ